MNRGVSAAAVSVLPATVASVIDVNQIGSLIAGISGVVLARLVFIDRENKSRRRRQTFRETLPLTLVAVLFTVVTILDHSLGLSYSAFTGLSSGWVAVLLLDTLGEWLLGLMPGPKKRYQDLNSQRDVPERWREYLDVLDKTDRRGWRALPSDDSDGQE